MGLLNLEVQCSECKYSWSVKWGNFKLPYTEYVKCPKCGHEKEITWHDDETRRKLAQKKLGLLDEIPQQNPKMDVLEKRLDTIEAKLTAITTEQELLRTKIDLITKDQLQKINAELSDHNFNINSIHDRVNKIDTQIEHAKKYGKFAPDE